MKTKNIFLSFATLMVLLFSACSSEAQNTEEVSKPKTNVTSKVEVIQFHSEHRCVTCRNIEAFTLETLKSYPEIPFSLVNVDDSKNTEQANKFEAAGTALFLYNSATGEKKELTDFAFMNGGNKEKFIKGLKKEIDLFLK